MRNTSSNSSSKDSCPYEVEVLLATFNGGLHIQDFLESLLQQRHVVIHLRVSDDGSSDETLEIIEEYRVKFKTLDVLSGPKQGPAENFLHLIRRASFKFVALAAQVDVCASAHLFD